MRLSHHIVSRMKVYPTFKNEAERGYKDKCPKSGYQVDPKSSDH
jgi:hypothetical protein